MKKYFFLFVLIFLFPSHTFANTFLQTKIDGITLKVIQYDLSSENYELKVWVSDTATTLENLMLDNNWISAVNGIFFCPSDYSECKWTSFTINERYVQGEKIAFYDDTGERVVYWWNKNKEPMLFQTGKINADKENEIFEGFANFPLLMKDWENMLEHYYDVGLIDKKMRAVSTRNFVCNDEKKENIYFWLVYGVSLDDLITVLSKFWCYDALNLDAWKSTAFIYNGRYLVWPQRNILDGLIIERKWLNVKEINEEAKKLSQKILSKINKKSLETKLTLLENIDKKLTDARGIIYTKYSNDIYDDNQSIVWYKIEIENLNILKKLYTINALQNYNKTQIQKIKEEIKNKK